MIARRHSLCFHLSLMAASATAVLLLGLQAQQSASRKLVTRTAPVYPELARSMVLQGTVKVEVVVAPDGSMKSVAVKGGHPVLA